MIKEGQITHSDLTWRRKIERDTLRKVKSYPNVTKATYRAVVKGKEIIMSFSTSNHKQKLIDFCEVKKLDFSIFTQIYM